MNRWLSRAAFACVALWACGQSNTAEHRSAIVHGEPSSDTSVVAIGNRRAGCEDAFGVLCTGTLVAADVVLAAAHCFEVARPGAAFEVFVGNEIPNGLFVDVVDVAVHPAFDDQTRANDVAVLRLANAVPDAQPTPILRAPLALELGGTVRMVGFGLTGIRELPDGIQRAGSATVTGIAQGTITTSGDATLTCQGDSGGPLFAEGAPEIIAVSSSGDATCMVDSVFSRIDGNDPFIQESLAAALPTRTDVPNACETTCSQDADCPNGHVCQPQPTGARCAVAGQVPGTFGAACTTDAQCPDAACVRNTVDRCACLTACDDAAVPPGPEPMGGGGCSVSWGRR